MLTVTILTALAIRGALQPGGSMIKITTDPLCPGRIDPMQCGQFIECLCNLVPGMWAEKLYDGHFVGLSPYKFDFVTQKDFKEQPWYPSGAVNRTNYSTLADNEAPGRECQSIEIENGAPATAGLSQDGIAVDPADPCRFSVWLREKGTAAAVHFRLSERGLTLASWSFQPSGRWAKFDTWLVPSARSTNATLTISFAGPGQLCLQSASLMPETASGGWRKDVVATLRSLNPHVIRFGGSALDDPNLGDFDWKTTVGDPDARKPFRAWGGLQQAGAGLEEIVQLCRRVGAEPLICVRTRERSAADAAEEVEYFNGAVTTPMGSWRARNGHPEPYRIKFWQVGNEQAGREYDSKLHEFSAAMKKADPKIQVLASFPTEGVLRGAGGLIDYVCPHHYDVENLTDAQRDFDDIRKMIKEFASGRSIKVGVTEWNTTAGDRGLRRARLWDLENALACARYQNLMHRNADLVRIANRSNLTNSFCSGIIQTDNARLYTTPTYWTQWLYSNLAGTRPLRIEPATSLGEGLDVSATLSQDDKALTLFAVNASSDAVEKTLDLSAFGLSAGQAKVWVLEDKLHAGEPDVTNSFDEPDRVKPVRKTIPVASSNLPYRFAAYSLTVIAIKR